jgi:hypothetical protein
MMPESALIIGPRGQMARLEGPRGTTPPCPNALFAVNQMLRIRRHRHLGDLRDKFCAVAAVIPPHFSPDWALADLRGSPRPLMAAVGRPYVMYLIGIEGDARPWLIREKYLRATDLPLAEITITKEP